MNSTKVEYKDKIEWYNEKGECHRTDGPAVEWSDGTKFWFLNGEYHREDGPAIEWSFFDGSKEWYLNGKEYSKEQWGKEVIRIKLKRLSEL